jgi:hypothetical protein
LCLRVAMYHISSKKLLVKKSLAGSSFPPHHPSSPHFLLYPPMFSLLPPPLRPLYIRLEVSLALPPLEVLSTRCTAVDSFSAVGLAFFSSSRSKSWFPQYLEVLRFAFNQIRSINFRRPLHHTLHSTRFHGPPASFHRQYLHHRI